MPNSFHVNGDQSGKGYLSMTYRPFTLEGNFAFALGITEMLLQSHTGIVHILPAITVDWNDVSFEYRRTVGAFLVSAKKEFGELVSETIVSKKGGKFIMKNPFAADDIKTNEKIKSTIGLIEFKIDIGEKVVLQRK